MKCRFQDQQQHDVYTVTADGNEHSYNLRGFGRDDEVYTWVTSANSRTRSRQASSIRSSSSSNSSSSSSSRARLNFVTVLWPFFLSLLMPRFTSDVAAFTGVGTSWGARMAPRRCKLGPRLMATAASGTALDDNVNNSSGRSAKPGIRPSRTNPSKSNNHQGLSRSFQSILSRTNNDRQQFVTGQYPVILTMEENPTLKWLRRGRRLSGSGGGAGRNDDVSTTQVLVNGTSIDQSLASYDRYQWLGGEERRELHDRYATVSMELLAEIHITRPGYVQVLPADGAGASAALSHVATAAAASAGAGWDRWRRDPSPHQPDVAVRELLDEAPRRDRLWVTGFSLAGRRGFIKSVDVHDGCIRSVTPRSESMILWPNEVNRIPAEVAVQPGTAKTTAEQHQRPFEGLTQDALLVSDGFLVPGKDRGGIYVIKSPGHKSSEWSICLTESPVGTTDQWFYHRAAWVDLTGDGRQSILTARAKLQKASTSMSTSGDIPRQRHQQQQHHASSANEEFVVDKSRPKNGQLVWLEMPQPHHFDKVTGRPLEADGTAFDPFSVMHLPWKERVLASGPDVMFAVADLDPQDDTIEVLASQFFDKKVTLHSIRRGPNPHVTFSRVIDDRCGAALGGILANLDPKTVRDHRVIDSGSTASFLGQDKSFSHFLVTSHECDYDIEKGPDGSFRQAPNEMYQNDHTMVTGGNSRQATLRGGSLFAYRVPEGEGAWRTAPWSRTTVASGFRVKSQIWNMINPGAPGFCYTFHAHVDDAAKGKRPMIAVAGDCAESAFLFRPQRRVANPDGESCLEASSSEAAAMVDAHAQYRLMCEVKCGATVGSIAIGYGDLCSAEQESGYAKIYIPCFEKDKILVFALGSGEEAESGDGW